MSDDHFRLFLRKGVYPYEYMNNFEKFEEIGSCSDVLLLADVFENFRDTCQEKYGLDPAHFYSAPGLAWAAALKYTGVELELLTDKDMLLLFEKGIRGELCQAIMHYAKANNKYMGVHYNKDVAYCICRCK